MVTIQNDTLSGSPGLTKCKCCGQVVPEARVKLGYRTCIKCAQAGVKPIREVTVAATSLQWF